MGSWFRLLVRAVVAPLSIAGNHRVTRKKSPLPQQAFPFLGTAGTVRRHYQAKLPWRSRGVFDCEEYRDWDGAPLARSATTVDLDSDPAFGIGCRSMRGGPVVSELEEADVKAAPEPSSAALAFAAMSSLAWLRRAGRTRTVFATSDKQICDRHRTKCDQRVPAPGGQWVGC